MNDTILTDPKKYFWLHSGQGIRSIRELLEAIPLLSTDEFEEHVNEEKNDFANWLEGIFNEKELATELRGIYKKTDFELFLYQKLMAQEVGRKKRVQEVFRKEQQKVFTEDASKFTRIKDKETKKQEKVGDRFAEEARKLDEKAHSSIPIMITRHDAFEQRLTELQEYIEQARKERKDLFLATQILRRYEPKLSYADVTGADEDYDQVEKILVHAEQELQDSYMSQSIDVRKEIDVLLSILHKDEEQLAIDKAIAEGKLSADPSKDDVKTARDRFKKALAEKQSQGKEAQT